MAFATEMEGIFTKEEIESFLKNEQQFYMEYAEENWLDRYFKMRAMSQNTHVPSVISVISDTPGGSNSNHSKTEQYALKSIQAREWLDALHEAIKALTPIEQKLIELKYMKKRNDGSRYADDVIYPQLFIGRTRYYELKKEALEMLGRQLYGLFSERGSL